MVAVIKIRFLLLEGGGKRYRYQIPAHWSAKASWPRNAKIILSFTETKG
jgi:hypothetical protein